MKEIINLENFSYHKNGEPKAKAAIVFLHGVATGAWCFEQMAGYFNTLGYTTYCIDLPGHGTRKKRKEKLSLERYRSTARNLVKIAKMDHEKVFVVGHSMGGLIAQTLGSDISTEGLILLAPAPTREVSFKGLDLGTLLKTARGVIDRIIGGERDIIRASLAQFFKDPDDPVIDRWADERVFEPLPIIAGIRFSPPHLDLPLTRKVFIGIPDGDRIISATTQRGVLRLLRSHAKRVNGYNFPLSHMFIAEAGWQTLADAMRDWMKAP